MTTRVPRTSAARRSATRPKKSSPALRKALWWANKDKLEAPTIAQIVALGYPQPKRDYRFATELGRQWSLDLAWPDVYPASLHGLRLAISIEGGGTIGRHARGSFSSDMEKSNAALLLGWAVFRYDATALKDFAHTRMLRVVWPLDRPAVHPVRKTVYSQESLTTRR